MYRIYTENKNRPLIEEILATHFDGFTVIPAKGWWKGAPEDALVIDIDTGNGGVVEYVAGQIKKINEQQAVMVVRQVTETTLV